MKNMEYTALYRKFRPLKFADIVGQEHIVKTLENEIIAGRVGHAYLFNGGRGTRKNHGGQDFSKGSKLLKS